MYHTASARHTHPFERPSFAQHQANQQLVKPVRTSARPTSQQASAITELLITDHSPALEILLLPMLAHLSRESDRWITWINPPAIDKSLLQQYGIQPHRVRMIHYPNTDDCRWILWEALSQGNSHTVIGTTDKLSQDSIAHLEEAGRSGNSRGILISYNSAHQTAQ